MSLDASGAASWADARSPWAEIARKSPMASKLRRFLDFIVDVAFGKEKLFSIRIDYRNRFDNCGVEFAINYFLVGSVDWFLRSLSLRWSL
jgi:hypothetical protein